MIVLCVIVFKSFLDVIPVIIHTDVTQVKEEHSGGAVAHRVCDAVLRQAGSLLQPCVSARVASRACRGGEEAQVAAFAWCAEVA